MVTSQAITAAAAGSWTGNPDHLAENVAAGALRLSPGGLARRDALDQGDA